MTDYGDITFTRSDDGVSVDGFPARIRVSPSLLADAQSGILESCVHISAANGYAEYHVVGWDGLTLECERVEASPKELLRP